MFTSEPAACVMHLAVRHLRELADHPDDVRAPLRLAPGRSGGAPCPTKSPIWMNAVVEAGAGKSFIA